MSLNLNKTILAGRLVAAPEVKQTQNGKAVCNFRIAVSRRFTTQGEHPESDFFPCQAWGNTAEFIGRYFPKGAAICVTGRIQNRTWEKDGQKHTTTEVIVEEANFVESKIDAQTVAQAQAPSAAQNNAPKFEEIKTDDDLPF